MSRQFRSDDTSRWKEGFGRGEDGDLTIASNVTEAPIDSSCSGTIGTNSLAATNASFAAGQFILIHKTRGNTNANAGSWELNKIASYVAGTITTKYPLQFTYTDSGADQSQVRVMPRYNNVTINNTYTLAPKAWNQNVGGILAFFAQGTVTINGILSAYAAGYRGGNHGTLYAHGYSGEGTVGDETMSGSANGNGGSGQQSNGGGGGNGTAGGNATSGGVGGSVAGNAGLTEMVFGGGGGGPGDGENPPPVARYGATGAGIILIIANDLIVNNTTGQIALSGQAGGSDPVSNESGSGAGGSCLIKCKTATLNTNRVTALGGGAVGNGGAGGVGRIHIDYKTSYTGTTNPAIDARQDLKLDYYKGASILRKLAE